jgi:hypothetical protein
MTRTRPTVLIGVPLVLTLALASAALLAPATASAAHEDCALVANAPSSYYGVDTITSASIECASPKKTIHFTMALLRDGVVVATSDRTCHKRADCWSYLVADDPPDDQVWCTRASARVGSHSVGEVTRCENDTNL